MRKKLWFNMEHEFSKALRIAKVGKLALYLILYLKENTYETANACVPSIPYNEDFINKMCFDTGPDGKQAKTALKQLHDKRIILYNEDERTIRLNYNVMNWRVTPEQYEKIEKLVMDENLTYEQGENNPTEG